MWQTESFPNSHPNLILPDCVVVGLNAASAVVASITNIVSDTIK